MKINLSYKRYILHLSHEKLNPTLGSMIILLSTISWCINFSQLQKKLKCEILVKVIQAKPTHLPW